MKISIITAVKNGEKTILDTLKSIHSQTYMNIEHIIVDSLSKDSTLEMIKQNSNNSIVISENDCGIYDGINKGILKSSGDIISILHADDFYAHKNVIQDVVDEFLTKNINFLYADLHYVDREYSNKVLRRWQSGSFDLRKLSNGWMPPHPTVFFKKSLVNDLGLFNLKYEISSDYDFMLRYLLCEKIITHYLPKTIIKMRSGGMSNNSVPNIFKKSIEDYKIIRRHRIGGAITLLLKNIRKIPQLFMR